ncbi:MAG TPA: GNAT family N-acetyltransferase [Candidatus Dormibacteraeota bacterium]|nr:GNAT family N-acetyltransferase [Candidatus Dormibacteraeota bacterium]
MIETERLAVRLAEDADVPEIIRFYSENRAHLQPFSPTYAPDFLDRSMWLDQVRNRKHEMAAGAGFRAFLFQRDDPTRIIGNLNLTQVHRSAFNSCVLGYNLAADAQGKGYMTEAVRGAVDFAFASWRLHRVAANYMPRNTRSAAVLQRCGFEVEGHARAYLLINGRWEDHVLTAITNPSWKPPTP